MRKLHLVLVIISCSLFSILAKATTQEARDTLIFGGAFRYAFMKSNWVDKHQDKGGQMVFDAVIFNVRGQYKGVDFAMESRYYAPDYGGFMLRNSYVGLHLMPHLTLKLGMPQTPFGILPYTSHSFMFNMQYYLGFEDDSDLGGLLDYRRDNWEFQLSYAKNAEDVFSSGNNRYAYDVTGGQEELNQFTGRSAYHFGDEKQFELGLSAQYGQLYNTTTREKGDKWAYAVHGVWQKKGWDFKGEVMAYGFNPDEEIDQDYIAMGAFAYDYEVAKKGLIYSASLGYKWTIGHRLLNDITFYNDFSALIKADLDYSISPYGDSYMNVIGTMLHVGPIYMLIDYVIAQNQAWIGPNYNNAFSVGDDTTWYRRFNVCLGIYY